MLPKLRRYLDRKVPETVSHSSAGFFRLSGCGGLDKPFSKADLLAKVAALLQAAPSAAYTRVA